MVSIDMIYDAQRVLSGVAHQTPVIAVPKAGKHVYIKAENLQLTGSFKLRGAYYKIAGLTDEEKTKGVIACSAGNHAQGVALAATRRGISSTICIPAGAPMMKVEATRNYGGEVVLVPGVYDDAYAKAMELMEEKGLTFIHPFNDEKVIAGQGTIGLEILQQLPDLDAVIIPIGGGGLISGVACAIKTLKPSCKVYGVQAAGAPGMYNSFRAGEIESLDSVSTIADGIAVKKPGDLTFEMCRKYVDDIVTVRESEIATAILTLMEQNKTVAEGAGAVALAAAIYGKVDVGERNVCCLVSGGNIDVTTLSHVITQGLYKTGRITEFTTKVVDKPGQLSALLQLISAAGANMISVIHERDSGEADIGFCAVKMVMETRDASHRAEIKKALESHGYEVTR